MSDTVPEYQTRVMNEKHELDRKVHTLYEFLNLETTPERLDKDEYARMLTQYRVMQIYSQILAERIANFKD